VLAAMMPSHVRMVSRELHIVIELISLRDLRRCATLSPAVSSPHFMTEPGMPFFRRGQASASPAGPQKQYPDELADKAALQYGGQDFDGAMETYATAIDKLHTMYVVAGQRLRKPGPQDQQILDGFRNSVGATHAMYPDRDLRPALESAFNYLGQIADSAGPESHRYASTIQDAQGELRDWQ
jgi:hypothetical protein